MKPTIFPGFCSVNQKSAFGYGRDANPWLTLSIAGTLVTTYLPSQDRKAESFRGKEGHTKIHKDLLLYNCY